MELEIGTLSIILIVGLLALISIGVPMGFASGFMGAVLVFYILVSMHWEFYSQDTILLLLLTLFYQFLCLYLWPHYLNARILREICMML